MKSYDVIIIGAGPSGCHCARLLSKQGLKVLLVERFSSVEANNFSSAGAPLEILKDFSLPDGIVGSYWKKIRVISTHISRLWESEERLGVVLDFAKLRQFLIDDAKSHNAEVLFNHTFLSFQNSENKTNVTLLDQKKNEKVTYTCSILVDATGAARSVMNFGRAFEPEYEHATGLEWLIRVDSKTYEKVSGSIQFFLGKKWAPYGYSWIFPIQAKFLKVGYGILSVQKKQERQISMQNYIELIIHDYLHVNHIQIIDQHGGLLRYRKKGNDIYHQDNIIAIGDCISTVNPLGGEGIRHGMHSASIASSYIKKYLQIQIHDFNDYEADMKKYFGMKWKISEWLSDIVYKRLGDKWIDRFLSFTRVFRVDEIMGILFYYKFHIVFRGIARWFRWKIKLKTS